LERRRGRDREGGVKFFLRMGREERKKVKSQRQEKIREGLTELLRPRGGGSKASGEVKEGEVLGEKMEPLEVVFQTKKGNFREEKTDMGEIQGLQWQGSIDHGCQRRGEGAEKADATEEGMETDPRWGRGDDGKA
jgi:hypothetical protein